MLRTITLDIARKMIDAMIRYAQDNRVLPGSFAVVDEGGHVIAAERRDNGLPATFDIAIDKAWTAATMKTSARVLEVVTRGQGWRLNVKYGGRLTIIPGSVPVVSGNKVIGGIGHSGGSAEEDEAIAQAGLSAFYREDHIDFTGEDMLRSLRRIADTVINYVMEKKLRPVAITIVDEWGWPVLIYRMDGVPYGYIEVSRDRAWTAAAFRVPSDAVVNEAGINYGVGWNERLTVTAGGVPFRLQDLMFAIGIAGNRPQDDKEIAISALKNVGVEPIV
ncbi:heme-binding protein [Vulcanisaeta sp. JCM 16161]|uniref:GlcG/HbpS family heme-binding protein n=1 Tax=Vulcanisaeta sp. JCM 16161 TaxID=1295372 RepID=UPI001FB4FEFF|nr:heme-binding protein [Vulcanisaeta sp. JCM 16161]